MNKLEPIPRDDDALLLGGVQGLSSNIFAKASQLATVCMFRKSFLILILLDCFASRHDDVRCVFKYSIYSIALLEKDRNILDPAKSGS